MIDCKFGVNILRHNSEQMKDQKGKKKPISADNRLLKLQFPLTIRLGCL